MLNGDYNCTRCCLMFNKVITQIRGSRRRFFLNFRRKSEYLRSRSNHNVICRSSFVLFCQKFNNLLCGGGGASLAVNAASKEAARLTLTPARSGLIKMPRIDQRSLHFNRRGTGWTIRRKFRRALHIHRNVGRSWTRARVRSKTTFRFDSAHSVVLNRGSVLSGFQPDARRESRAIGSALQFRIQLISSAARKKDENHCRCLPVILFKTN